MSTHPSRLFGYSELSSYVELIIINVFDKVRSNNVFYTFIGSNSCSISLSVLHNKRGLYINQDKLICSVSSLS